jgi:integrase
VTFGDVPLRSLRRAHVEEWVKAMTLPAETRKGELAASTIRTRFNYVHMALAAAVRDRLIVENPATGVTLPKRRRRHIAMTIPTPDQVRKALDAAPAEFRAYVALCAFAGLRLGEAAAVQAGDIDVEASTLRVRRQVQGQVRDRHEIVGPKAGSERDVPIPPNLTDALAAHIKTLGTYGDERWLFQSGNALLNRNSAGHQWRLIRAKVGLEEFTLHDLRHFYASGLIAAGCDVVTVQRALGHASASITLNTYSHLWPTAEDRTRAAATELMRQVGVLPADSVRTDEP